jgi:hypothetical protein
MTSGNEDIRHNHSEFGIAACIVGFAMIAVQLSVLTAVFLGIKDNTGIIYAASIPFIMYLLGVPIGLLAALIGFIQPRRHRKFAKLGVALTLTGPLVFAVFFAVQSRWHPW